MSAPSLTTLPTELRMQILSSSTPTYRPTPASTSPCTPIHGHNPLLRVSRQIRHEAQTLPQPTAVTVVHVRDLDREVGRRNVDERDFFRKLLVLGVGDEDGAKNIESMLRECWMLVERVALPKEAEDDGSGLCREVRKGHAVCFNVRGACIAWSHYPWYMQAGAHMMEWERLNHRMSGCRLQ